MRLRIAVELDYHFPQPADVLLAVEVAQLPEQRLVEDLLTIDGVGPLRPIAGEEGIGRRTWMRADGPFRARYGATVDVRRDPPSFEGLEPVPRRDLPAGVIPYIWPSRYCESDRFETFVARTFDGVEGGAMLTAMAEWIHQRLEYVAGSSDASTTAADVFVSRQGVCRDYAHLFAAFARAAGVPARLVSAYGLKVDPPDFHALVEVWLGGAWHLIDPSRVGSVEGVVRICVGRDATDIAFMSSFGAAELVAQKVEVTRLDEARSAME